MLRDPNAAYIGLIGLGLLLAIVLSVAGRTR
jgi:hypothetical protein